MAALATPRTWVVGEVVTAAQLNAELRDQFNVLKVKEIKTGSLSVSFTSLDQFTGSAVTFTGTAFTATPVVGVFLPTTAGATSRWNARGTSVTTAGFTPFYQSGTSGATATWSSIGVTWVAWSS